MVCQCNAVHPASPRCSTRPASWPVATNMLQQLDQLASPWVASTGQHAESNALLQHRHFSTAGQAAAGTCYSTLAAPVFSDPSIRPCRCRSLISARWPQNHATQRRCNALPGLWTRRAERRDFCLSEYRITKLSSCWRSSGFSACRNRQKTPWTPPSLLCSVGELQLDHLLVVQLPMRGRGTGGGGGSSGGSATLEACHRFCAHTMLPSLRLPSADTIVCSAASTAAPPRMGSAMPRWVLAPALHLHTTAQPPAAATPAQEMHIRGAYTILQQANMLWLWLTTSPAGVVHSGHGSGRRRPPPRLPHARPQPVAARAAAAGCVAVLLLATPSLPHSLMNRA